ncbi:TPA: transcriptional regulator CecR [Escherichia coli]|nr:transcriptional regulator CecR [Escherichia coli]
MNNPAMTIKGEQAKKQLIAAALAQFGEYGMNATTREIAAQAGQNIAAITYYFGSKEDLYLACAQWIADFIGEQFRPHAEEAERLFAQPQPDRAAIRELILRACRNMIKLLTQDDTVNLSKFISREQLSPTAAYHLVHEQVISKFISREQLSPTAAYHLVHEQVISPLHSHLTRLIAAWTGCDANDTRMILHTHALIGEILAFRLGKETILLRTGWTAFDEEKTELINQTVTCHIDLILQGLSQRSL